jgi:hypothetical protein
MSEQHICNQCGTPMETFTTQPHVGYKCPKGHQLYLVTCSDSAELNEGLGLHATSADKIGKVPVQEIIDYRPHDGTTSRVEVTRTENGATVEASASGRKVSSEADEEEAVGVLFIDTYNRERATQFPAPRKFNEQASLYDLTSTDSSGCCLRMQVTVADSCPWGDLNTKRKYDNSEDERAVFKELAQGIRSKEKYDPAEKRKTILLLDGWPVLPSNLIALFVGENIELLTSIGYQEIWYVPRGGFQAPTCLYPVGS